MAQQAFVIVCESAVIDKETNNLYVLGVFDSIHATGVPVMQPNLYVVSKFEGERGQKHDHKIVIVDPSGEEFAKLEGQINFERSQTAQYIGRFLGLVFTEFGEYRVDIFLDGNKQPLSGKFVLEPKQD